MKTAVTTEMTNAEFAVLRERLGLSYVNIAELLGVQERSVQRWDDTHKVPDAVQDWLRSVAVKTAQLVASEVQRIRSEGVEVIRTYRTDEGFRDDHPDSPFCAEWHRAWVGRVFREVPDLRVEYKD